VYGYAGIGKNIEIREIIGWNQKKLLKRDVTESIILVAKWRINKIMRRIRGIYIYMKHSKNYFC